MNEWEAGLMEFGYGNGVGIRNSHCMKRGAFGSWDAQ